MKVLRIYPFLPPLAGGMEKHIMRLSQEQRRQGNDVTIAFSKGEPTSANDIRICPKFNLKGMRPQSLRDLCFYSGLIFHLYRYKLSFDAVHIHGAWSAFIFGAIIKKISGASVLIGSIHDGINKNRVWVMIYKIIFKRYNFLYSTGNNDAKFLSSVIGSKVYWRSSGIDDGFFLNGEPSNKDIDVINVGSFVLKKNHTLILDIAKKLPQIKFALIGDGPLLHEMKQKAKNEAIDNVNFMGALPYEEVAAALKRSKIFLMTSFLEGTPTALLESMAAGNVVITSNSNDFSNIIENNVSGYIINNFDVLEYVQIISGLINNPDMLLSMAKINIQRSKDYSWPKVSLDVTNWIKDEI